MLSGIGLCLLLVACWPTLAMAVTMEQGVAKADEDWSSFSFVERFERPVAIAGPPTYRGSHPGVARLDGVSRSGFRVRFEEWDFRKRRHGDDAHKTERIPYLVLDTGRHSMPDGSIWEVGTFELNGTGAWQRHRFARRFPARPKLFLTLQTAHGDQTVIVRARQVHRSGFEAALFEEEALMNGHVRETIG
jgi:hypothetical protein